MRYLLIAFLAFSSSAQAQLFESHDDGYRRHRTVCHCWRDEGWNEEKAEYWRRIRYRHRLNREERGWRRGWRYHARHHHWRHHERSEGYIREERREKEEGYRGWRHPGREEVYRGWWQPEGGWRESALRDGPRRCRPPLHAAGDADVRIDAARNKAIKSWQEQVINEHGERFLNFDSAYVIDEHCDPARVGEERIIDLKRCVVTAAPCLPARDRDAPANEESAHEGEHK